MPMQHGPTSNPSHTNHASSSDLRQTQRHVPACAKRAPNMVPCLADHELRLYATSPSGPGELKNKVSRAGTWQWCAHGATRWTAH